MEAPSGERTGGVTVGWHAVILVLAVGIFLAPAWLGGGFFLARDNGRMHAPVKRFLAAELSSGRWPEWNPYSGLGTPVVAAAVDGIQHPFTLLLLLLPLERAISAWVLLSLAVAALGAFWWARELGASPEAAMLAGLAYAFGGALVSTTDNLQYLTALATLPAYFAAAGDWMSKGGAGRLASLGALSYLLAAAGDPVSWGLGVTLAPALALALGGANPLDRRRGTQLGQSLLVVAVGMVAAAPVIAPLLLWLPHSSRSGAIDALAQQRWSLAPLRLSELVVPHLLRAPPGTKISALHQALADPASLAPWSISIYLGVTVVILALSGLRGDRRIPRLVALAAAFAWMAMGEHAGFGQVAVRLPLLQGVRYWEKLVPWTTLLLAVAAALAADHVFSDLRAARRLGLVALAVAGLAVGGIATVSPVGRTLSPTLAAQLAGNLRDGFLHAAAFAGALGALMLAAARGWPRARGALVLLVAFDLAAANARAYELLDPVVLAPAGPLAAHLHARQGLERVLTPFEPAVELPGLTPDEATNLLGARTLAAAWNVGFGVGNFDTYTGPVPSRAAEIDRQLAPDRLLPNVGLWAVGHVVVPGRLAQAAAIGLAPPWQVEAEDRSAPAWLLALPHRPRAYLAERIREVGAGEALAFALDRASAGSDLTVVEGAIPLSLGVEGGRAEVVEELVTRVHVITSASAQALLVLNDTWAPGWTARVDGASVPILRANYLVRGVVVPAGKHQVLFEYRTPGLREGWAAALAGWAALGLVALRTRLARHRVPVTPRP